MDDRTLLEIHLPESRYKVSLLPFLKFGEQQKIEGAAVADSFQPNMGMDGRPKSMNFTGLNFEEVRRVKFLTIIKSIQRPPEGPEGDTWQEVPLTMETIDDLSVADGKILDTYCNDLVTGEKKMG